MICINVMSKSIQRTLNKRRSTAAWIANNRDKVRANDQARYKRDKVKRDALNRKWAVNNPDKIADINKKALAKWRKNNLERVRKNDREGAAKRYAANPEKYRAKTRAWQKANPEKVYKMRHDGTYGDGAHEHFQQQVMEQGNCCAVCKEAFTSSPHLDHNHETEQWRGALCCRCNVGLGNFRENQAFLQAAVEYLQAWS